MSVQEVGAQIAKLCNEGKNLEAIEKFYSPVCVSIEAFTMDPMPLEAQGLEAIKAKNEWWLANHEIHSSECVGPYCNGEQFCLIFRIDVTSKPMGNQRMQLEEVGVYTVEGGKIIEERFFYTMGPPA